ncbi:hypothetical protein [Paludisphaera mucosa]|uniref:Uncharacterized protein n=1 Tax=Paludisphaera mucosa TaxID=3030827 RepID=A0ABT6F4C7_9BACT|nr:hypothetical protein [Paludisphaera mucosa]MDG3002351.1 hypothetical protein [Paludisphaera mucosa]
MTAETRPANPTTSAPAPRDRRRFAAAVALFLAWIAFLVGLAVTDAQRPMERAGAVPDAERPAQG